LFTGIIMPGAVGGRKLSEGAAEIKPAIKVLSTSGYAEKSVVHDGRFDRGWSTCASPTIMSGLPRWSARVLENPERTGAGHKAPSNPLSWQINKACPAKNINPSLTIDRI
jgi:hypothetical protein